MVGTDGGGLTPARERMSFDAMVQPSGTWAHLTTAPTDGIVPMAEAVDDMHAATLRNAGLAAWVTLTWQAKLQKGKGEPILVSGACGALGRMAQQGACALGAGVALSADRPGPAPEGRVETGPVTGPFGGEPERFADELIERARSVETIIALLWCPPALVAIKAVPHGARVVQMDRRASPSLHLMATELWAHAVDVSSCALFRCPFDDQGPADVARTNRATHGDMEIDVEAVALSNVEGAWDRHASGVAKALVLVPDGGV